MCKKQFVMLMLCLTIGHEFLHANISITAKDTFIVNNEDLQQLLNKAQNLVKDTNYKKAIDVYNEALLIASKQNLSDDISFIYKKIGLIYYNQDKLKQAEFHFKKVLLLDSISQNAADVCFNLALTQRKLNDKDNLLIYLNKSVSIYATQKDSNKKYDTYRKASILYRKFGLYDKTMELLLLAYTYYDQNNNLKSKASVCNKIGITQRLIGNKENLNIAEQYYRESLKIRIILNDTIGMSGSYNSMANIFKSQKKYDAAISYYKKAIDLRQKVNNAKELGKMWSNLASIYQLKDNKEKALKTFKKALKIKKTEKDTTSISYTYNELALISIENNQMKQAKRYLDSSMVYLSEISNNDLVLRNTEVQSVYYKSNKNYFKALTLREKYQTLYQKTYNEKQSKIIQNLQEQFESRLKQKKIDELSLNVISKTKTIKHQKGVLKQKNWILIVLMITSLSLWLYFKQRQKAKAKQYELNKLESIIESQEQLKEAIGVDLHDITGHHYNGIQMKILALSKSKNFEKSCKEIVEEISQVNREVRLISHRLSPLGDRIKGSSLTQIIEDHLIEIQHYNKIFIDVKSRLPEELNSMKLKSQTNYYGILLEIFNNIVKHSFASKVIIENKLDHQNKYMISIQDNGKGFSETNNGIGMNNIQYRIQLLKGESKIKSSDKGTKVTIMIPIKQNT